jgi:uncharacterized protein YbjT (DUF2867 family)
VQQQIIHRSNSILYTGSAVVRSLLKDGGFTVRGVTRDANSAKAKALRDAGVQVVEANLLIKDTVEKAVAGSEAIFAVGCLPGD